MATIVTCVVFFTLGVGPLGGTSSAGTYTATECHAGNAYSDAQPGEYGHHFFGLTRDCSAGGDGLNISLPQAYWAWGYARWTVYAPSGTHMVNVSGAQQGTNADGWVVQLHACSPSDCGANVYVSGDGYWRTFGTPSGDYNNWWIQVVCGQASCFGSLAAGAHVRDVTMTMSDDVAPNVSESGQLLNGEVQRGAGRLDIAPTDVGAGLTSAWVVVNDQEVARQNYGCAGVPVQPCALTGAPAQFDLDTQSTPFHDGKNTVQACTADYGAPPNVTCTAKQVVKVDNSCTPSSVPGGSHLSAVFSQSHRRIVHVKAGHGARLIGRLTDNSGDPVAGATLCIKEGVAGAALASVGTVTTNANGRYRFRVAPGPNRKLKVGYRYNRDQVDRRARFKSRLRPRLKLSPERRTRNGKRLLLYGSIAGPRKNGRIVILQASAINSNSWLTFQKARTDRLGEFTARYRFKATRTTTKYRFRALVPPQNGYPYEGGTSRAKEITVIGR